MKVEQKHLRNKTWLSLITVGDRQFNIHSLSDGFFRLHEGTYSPRRSSISGRCCGGMFESHTIRDFNKESDALYFCKALEQ